MITSVLSALCFLGVVPQGATSASAAKWPLVPNSLFAVSGLDSSGVAQAQHMLIAVKGDSSSEPKAGEKDTTSIFFGLPSGSPAWKSMQILFTSTADGTLARFGGVSLVIKGKHVWFAKEGNQFDIAPIRDGALNDIQLVKHYDSLLAYVNGERAVQTIIPTTPLFPVQVGLDSWKGIVLGVCGYAREVTGDEVVAIQHSGLALGKSLFADTKTVTVEAELTAMTPVPELSHIAPYRTALVAEEYKIVRIVSGRMSAVKPDIKIRIFRTGLSAGDKTDVAKAKIGDKAQMVIQPLSADPKYEKEFQVDTLDNDISALYFVDVTPAK